MSHSIPLLFVTLIGIIICLLSRSVLSYYQAHSFQQLDDGFLLSLDLVSPQSSISTPIKKLSLRGQYWRNDVFRMTIRDRENARWEVPDVLLSQGSYSQKREYAVDFQNSPFSLTVVREADQAVLLNLTNLIYNDQYIAVETALQSSKGNPNIYGFGERVHNFRLDSQSKTYTLFAFDHGTPVDQPLYGSHPFHMQYLKGKFHGGFMLNSNAMDVVLEPTKLTYKMIGGIVDLFTFVGPTAESVMQQYHQSVIGTPKMIPFWALGNHQCRWGYKNIGELEAVGDKYDSLGIPIDTLWSDIDWMEAYKDFVPDPVNYNAKDVQQFVARLKQKDRHYTVILDPGIKIEKGYQTFEEGVQQDVYLQSAVSKKPLVGKVWPGLVYYPDFTKQSTIAWWKQQITRFIASYPVDALWIDMNEVSNFLPNGECFFQEDGSCKDRNFQNELTPKNDFNPNSPPYVPGNMRLIDHGVSLDAIHGNGSIEYNMHTLYGYYEARATTPALQAATNKRSLIISRSTYPGSGRYVQHWLGDNNSAWSDLFYSISGILNFQMFGVPFVGADICGFSGNSNAELCGRWIQTGAFYPFTRNHNANTSNPQEYYVFGDKVVAIARSSILTKYALLSYYYTLFHKASRFGGSVMRPIVFEFPADTHPDLPFMDRQFMVGSAILVLPVLNQGATSVDAYVPGVKGQDLWYDYFSGEYVNCAGYCNFDAPFEKINVLMRGGHSILIHDVIEGKTTTTAQARRDGYRLIVALDSQKESSGDIFIDDGDSIDVGDNYIFAEYQHKAKTGSTFQITSTAAHSAKIGNINTQLNSLVIYGVQASSISSIRVGSSQLTDFDFHADTGVLIATLSNLNVDIQNIDIEYVISE